LSKDWVADIANMHKHYGHDKAVEKMNGDKLREFLKFRIDFLQEELDEMKDATLPDDVIDALIDLCVVAIGTLDGFGVDAYKAWDVVLKANMEKKTGVKEGRPNPLGLPDLMKPEGWVGPDHSDQRTRLDYVFLDMWCTGKAL
jgi:hypothetical protein